LPVRVIRSERGRMLSDVSGRGLLPTLLSPLLSAGRTLTHLTTPPLLSASSALRNGSPGKIIPPATRPRRLVDGVDHDAIPLGFRWPAPARGGLRPQRCLDAGPPTPAPGC